MTKVVGGKISEPTTFCYSLEFLPSLHESTCFCNDGIKISSKIPKFATIVHQNSDFLERWYPEDEDAEWFHWKNYGEFDFNDFVFVLRGGIEYVHTYPQDLFSEAM